MIKTGNLVVDADVLVVLESLRQQNGKYFSKGIKSTSKDYVVQCPYHKDGQETTPSGFFRKEDGFFHCFGCGVSHPFHDVVEHVLNENGKQWLAKNFKSKREDFNFVQDLPKQTKTERKIELDFNKEKEYIREEELDRYNFYHPYMTEKRHISPDIIRKFKVGYDRSDMTVVFPMRDELGNILFLAKRSVKTKFFSCPENVDKPLYGLFEIKREIKNGVNIDKIYVTESIIDALTIWTYGEYAIALSGIGSYNQMELLNNLPFRNIILALDNDSAGRKGTERIKKNVKKLFKKVILPDGKKDINDLTREEFKKLKIVLA